MSISTGNLEINGASADYELRMPAYELIHTANPERMLLESVRLRSSGQDANLREHSCRLDQEGGSYHCTARYEFPSAPDSLTARCTFHTVTVANHVHVLRIRKSQPGGLPQEDQAVFDISHPEAEIRFAPPTATRVAIREIAGGLMRSLGGLLPLLFLAAVALSVRANRQIALQILMLLAGQLTGCLLALQLDWRPAPRFIEAALALAAAYLAAELVILPKAGGRSLIVGLLGAFSGFYLAVYLRQSDSSLPFTLLGAALGQAMAIALGARLFLWLRNTFADLPVFRMLATGLLLIAAVWFAQVLRGR